MAGKYFGSDKLFFANTIRAFSPILAEEGMDIDSLLAEVGIDSETIRREEPEISIEELVSFIRVVRHKSKDPSIMLKAGSAMNISTYGILGYAMMCSATLADAYRISEEYSDIIGDIFITSDVEEKNGKIIETFSKNAAFNPVYTAALDARGSDADLMFVSGVEISLASLQTLFCNLIGDAFSYESIFLGYQDPGYADSYENLFQCPVHFDHDRTMAVMDSALAATPLPFSNPLTLNTCLRICDDFLNRQLNSRSLTTIIRKMLMSGNLEGPTLEEVANQLHVSPRTLRRHLKEQGTSFQTIFNNVRKELAVGLLKETRLPIEEISSRLNFSDTANFRSAFKRWTGMTPGAYRKLP